MNKSRYRKIAEEAYERIADSVEDFDLDEVIAEIAAELSGEAVNAELVREFAASLAHAADDRAAKRADDEQLDLLTGEPVALDAVWRLGDGRRIRARNATRAQVMSWIGVRSANAERVRVAHERDMRTVAELLVYMPDAMTTVAEAIETRKREQR